MKRLLTALTGIILLAVLATTAQAVTIETVPVGNLGNAADMRYNLYERPEGYGAVDYAYNIGKYNVTNAQWREFLTAKATVGDPYGLYNTYMADKYGGISRSGAGTLADPYVYTAKGATRTGTIGR